MKKKLSLFCVERLIIIAIFLLASCSARAQEASSSEMAKAFSDAGLQLLSRKVSPRDFSLPVAMGAETLTLSDLKGKVVFLNFWATWCPPCRDEMPSMESLYRRFRDRGLEIVAVNIREAPEQVRGFIRDYDLSFPIPLDSDGGVSNAYGIQAIPTSFIIDREGQIISRVVGSLDWDTAQIRTLFDHLLR